MNTPTYLLLLYVTRDQEEAITSLFSEKHWALLRADKQLLFPARRHIFTFHSLQDTRPTVTVEGDHVSNATFEALCSKKRTFGNNQHGAFVLDFPNTSKQNTCNEIKECSVSLEKLPQNLVNSARVSLTEKPSPVSKSDHSHCINTALKKRKVSSKNETVSMKGRQRGRKLLHKARKGNQSINTVKKEQDSTSHEVMEKKDSFPVINRSSKREATLEEKCVLNTPMEAEEIIDENNYDDDEDENYEPKQLSGSESDISRESETKEKGDKEYVPYVYKYKKHIKKSAKNMKENRMLNKEKIVKVRKIRQRKPKDEMSGKGEFPCATCKKVYRLKRRYLKHLSSGECRNKCKYCGKVCSKNTIAIHIFNRHEKYAVKFSCNICGKRFFQQHMLRSHMQIHSDIKQFVCDLCGKAYSKYLNFVVHKKKHEREKTNTRFPCPICNKLFATKGYVQYHLNVTHAEDKKYMCDLCGNTFKTIYSLKNHKRATHRGERNYQCDICKRYYKYSHQVSTHKKTSHEKLIRFTCQFCNKGFYFEYAFKDHMNIHNGIKAHSCASCDYTSHTREQLTQHKRKHRQKIPPKVAVETLETEQAVSVALMQEQSSLLFLPE